MFGLRKLSKKLKFVKEKKNENTFKEAIADFHAHLFGNV